MKNSASLAFSAIFLLSALPLSWVAAAGLQSLEDLKAQYVRPKSVPFPDENPYSQVKAELGKKLFFDPVMSGPRTVSCGTCHQPNLAWGDGRPKALGVDPTGMNIRSPTLIDVGFVDGPLGWDGKFHSIEDVTFGPITGRVNMNLSEGELMERLKAVPAYVHDFTAAFGDNTINKSRIEQAIATYERTIVAKEAPFDRWIDGDEKAISQQAKHGFAIFNGKGKCADCHSGPSFTDGSFQDIGTATGDDTGRGRYFPTSEKLRYAFKTPTLRDVAKRAPYMHDGAIPTLEAVIDHYNKGGIDRPSRSPSIKPLHLTAEEKSDLIVFLKTLTGDSPSKIPYAEE
ncbi:MAG: tryptophan tryptophylquinone biosynthesis enzyme MauG [Xanthobacteraceae bacterium]|nr:tryptophan tryptophylquinone biosynthesis enzyme MauG [Xanthobacteraceae bacterium]